MAKIPRVIIHSPSLHSKVQTPECTHCPSDRLELVSLRVGIRQVGLTTRDSRKGSLARDMAHRCLHFRPLLMFCCWIGLSMLTMKHDIAQKPDFPL